MYSAQALSQSGSKFATTTSSLPTSVNRARKYIMWTTEEESMALVESSPQTLQEIVGELEKTF